MNHRPDHVTSGNHQAEGALECDVEVQPISGADLRRGRYVRYDGHGSIIPLYRWASGQDVRLPSLLHSLSCGGWSI